MHDKAEVNSAKKDLGKKKSLVFYFHFRLLKYKKGHFKMVPQCEILKEHSAAYLKAINNKIVNDSVRIGTTVQSLPHRSFRTLFPTPITRITGSKSTVLTALCCSAIYSHIINRAKTHVA